MTRESAVAEMLETHLVRDHDLGEYLATMYPDKTLTMCHDNRHDPQALEYYPVDHTHEEER